MIAVGNFWLEAAIGYLWPERGEKVPRDQYRHYFLHGKTELFSRSKTWSTQEEYPYGSPPFDRFQGMEYPDTKDRFSMSLYSEMVLPNDSNLTLLPTFASQLGPRSGLNIIPDSKVKRPSLGEVPKFKFL